MESRNAAGSSALLVASLPLTTPNSTTGPAARPPGAAADARASGRPRSGDVRKRDHPGGTASDRSGPETRTVGVATTGSLDGSGAEPRLPRTAATAKITANSP